MKFFLKLFMAWHVSIYRLTGGRLGGYMGFPILLLTTTGRKSGKVHTNPLTCLEHDDGFIIIASNGGADSHPAWFWNLQANPQVTFQVMGNVMTGRAEILTGQKRAETWNWVVQRAPQYAKYAYSTSREIPVISLRQSK
jgi:deazaflavin-dependent oxidoreductase (nitroreductase family)